MHPLASGAFFTTLFVSVALTTLISRILLMAIGRRGFSLDRLPAVHGASLAISWAFFVLWCSTPEKIYWFAGHVAFAPQALWFFYDVLRPRDGADAEEEAMRPDTDTRETD